MKEDWKAPIREALLKEGDVEKLKIVKVYSGCNGLGTIYIYHSFEEGPFGLTTRYMSLELRHNLGKVLGTQNYPTLRLAFPHCVLCFNPIKGTLNIVVYT